MPKWTEEQKEAIYKTGTNIIVSAGAGSGKTAVLTQRVINKLNSTKIDKLLVLTFTTLAAHEMKERIRAELIKLDDKDNLGRLDSSYITTFDSYALSIVKKYHYLLNLDSNVSIVDSNIIKVKEYEYIDKIFEQLYEEKNEKFINLINNFCLKDDKEIRNQILNINSKLNLKTDKISYLNEYISKNFTDESLINSINCFFDIIFKKITLISHKLKKIHALDCNEYYEKLKKSLLKIMECKSYDDVVSNIDIKLPILPKNSDEELKSLKKSISDILKEIKSMCIYESEEAILKSLYLTKDNVDIIIHMIKELSYNIKNYKDSICSYEFNDIAIMACNIIKNNKEVRQEIKDSFDEILIDEYQDTNDLQEEFINLIQNNNVYMVGDIKQSIYRFRNANPYLFKNKYDMYKNKEQGIKIDLNKNFRSRKEVISSINTIFEHIMSDDIGGVSYNEGHAMEAANTSYKDNNQNLDIYTYDDSENFSKEEQEIFFIANDIKEKIKNSYQIIDKKNFENRNIKYSDIAILIDRTTNFDLYKKIFEYMKIPLTLVKDEIVTKNVIVLMFRNILNLILKVKKNEFDKEFKYLFMSVSRSFLIEEKDELIFNQINGDFLNSVLMKKINNLIDFEDIIVPMLIDKIIKEFEFFERLEKIGDVDSSLALLNYIKDLSHELSNIGYDIYEFTNFLNMIKDYDFEIKYKTNIEDQDSVKIMTIHKSKGLEFPVCYYSMLYKKFNIKDLKDKFMYDNKIGIITPFYDNQIGETIYKFILKNNYIKEEISERVRLFYVALTRAREKMIIVSPKFDNAHLLNEDLKADYRSFYDILNSINYLLEPYIKNINFENIQITSKYRVLFNNNIDIPKEKTDLSIKKLNINNEVLEQKKYSKEANELITQTDYENIEYGKKIHQIFEMIDLKHPEYSNIDNLLALKIKNFLNNDIFTKIEKAKIYKEYEFEYFIDNKINKGVIDLMVEYDDYIDIIDYKLSNIDDSHYNMQLIGYKNYINSITNKPVNIYLYSILNDTFKKV